MELIDKKEFTKGALDENIEAFKAVTVLAKYSDFANVFSKKSAAVLPERTDLNEHTIKLQEGKQPPYGPIYNLKPVELKTLKT